MAEALIDSFRFQTGERAESTAPPTAVAPRVDHSDPYWHLTYQVPKDDTHPLLYDFMFVPPKTDGAPPRSTTAAAS